MDREKNRDLEKLTDSIRPNEVVEILKTYMEYDLRIITDDATVLGEMHEKLKDTSDVTTLLDTCIDKTKKYLKTQHSMGVSDPYSDVIMN